MKVLLSKDVPNLGRKGQVVEVSDGHARNFLIPRFLALPATSAMLIKIQKEESEASKKVQKQQQLAIEIKKRIEGKTVKIKGKASSGHLFAAIHEEKIAEAVNKTFHLAILPKQVIIKQAIKALGFHEAIIKLTETVQTHVKIEIENQS